MGSRKITDWNPPSARDGLGVYVHIPLCRTKCSYCDFNTYAAIEHLEDDIVSAIVGEVRAWQKKLGRLPLKTIFFGGGTPSYVSAHHLTAIVEALKAGFGICANAELTLEANPDDVTRQKADDWLKTGFNRISIGAQSFNDTILKRMGRRHNAEQVKTATATARETGFTNISLDLIFDWPGQTLADWQRSLEQTLLIDPQHVSLYDLQIEPNTPLERDVAQGRLKPASNDLAAEMYRLAIDTLVGAGYGHYEISNWCKPGYESRHNLRYWHDLPYLGVGPGAHSSLGGVRYAVVKSPKSYIKLCQNAETALKTATLFAEVEQTDRATAMIEFVMLGLRKIDGFELARFEERFSRSMEQVWGAKLRELEEDGLLLNAAGVVRLTGRGVEVANEVVTELMNYPLSDA